eukprot:5815470-Prymnesium_polylepis.1
MVLDRISALSHARPARDPAPDRPILRRKQACDEAGRRVCVNQLRDEAREHGTRARTRERHGAGGPTRANRFSASGVRVSCQWAPKREGCVCVLRVYGDGGRHVCVLTGYEDAAHEHGTRAGRANDASGVARLIFEYNAGVLGAVPSQRAFSHLTQGRVPESETSGGSALQGDPGRDTPPAC